MSATECTDCGAALAPESRVCPHCGSPAPEAGPGGVEARIRTYWSAPDLGLLAGVAVAGIGIVLVGFQVWLWGALALLLAAVLLVLRSEAGRRQTTGALAGARAHVGSRGRVVGARSRGQVELFRLRRELAELQSERSGDYHELGRATHVGDAAAAEAAKTRLDEVGATIAAKGAEIDALVGEMQERLRQAQGEAPPEPARIPEPYPPPDEGDPPEPARVPEPFPEPVPEPSPGDPPPKPQHPPAPETRRRKRSGASNA